MFRNRSTVVLEPNRDIRWGIDGGQSLIEHFDGGPAYWENPYALQNSAREPRLDYAKNEFDMGETNDVVKPQGERMQTRNQRRWGFQLLKESSGERHTAFKRFE
ncbi:hypothetical protein ARMSODRAFT_959804 [Armillaria solidipes]|uniref:Uncharacterized protein n=1 Tax=Armillaria solidipes TaxID=1076256 RepID=A0A2H3BQ10_9AGAR|nr:hypothetical protein ARMSODRAFT_959804 [Armillaria solidipes]